MNERHLVTTYIRRDPPDTRWLAELTLPDGRVIRRRAATLADAERQVTFAEQEMLG